MNVIAPKQFQARIDAETLERLRREGAQIEDASGIDEVLTREVQYGEELLGPLTDEECSLFMAAHTAKVTANDLGRKIHGDMMIRTGQHIQTSEKLDLDVLATLGGQCNPDEMREVWRHMHLHEYLFNMLFYGLGERFVSHDWRMGLRSKRRVVRVERRW